MKQRPRKLYAVLGVAAGVVLVAFEVRPALAGNGEDIFWVVIAVLLIAFGLAEAFAGR